MLDRIRANKERFKRNLILQREALRRRALKQQAAKQALNARLSMFRLLGSSRPGNSGGRNARRR